MSDKNLNEGQNRRLARTIYQKVKGLLPLSTRIFLATRVISLINGFTHLDRTLLSSKYLSGDGIEIGALHAPLQVNRSAKVKYVDRVTLRELREIYPELDSYDIVEPDILDDGEQLGTVQDLSQDFVIANHFLEHCQNPLQALKNIYRVLRVGGLMFLALPNKRFTFDVDRPVTTIDHMLRDLEEGPGWSKRGHYEEWVRVVAKLSDQEAEKQIHDNAQRDLYPLPRVDAVRDV
jgi:SAM-dependent methyltransferase